MNLPKFLKTVDTLTKNMSHGELEVFIHNFARVLPEEKREGFVENLKTIGKVTESDEEYKRSDKKNKTKLLEDLSTVKQQLLRIDEGEICLTGELNEEYDDWYNSDVDEFLFEDPEDILGTIDTSMDLIHKCVDQELYEEGYELAEMLSVLSVQVEGEYIDYSGEDLTINDLDSYRLLTCDFDQLVQDALYLSYVGNELEERPDALYRMIYNLECKNVRLEQVMQNGKEEWEQFDAFLKLWLAYLGTYKGGDTEKLILEAQSLLNDEDQMLENARKYASIHPALFEQYLSQNLTSGDDIKLFNIGQEALRLIPCKYEIRSRVALLTSQYALRLQKTDEAEKCWVEAFRSETSPVNYMRIFTESRDYSRYRKEVTDIYTTAYRQSMNDRNNQYGLGELTENRLEKNQYYALLFLDGEFQKMIETGMNTKEPLGWSWTFMKQGISLLLLYLFQGDELPVGLRKMCGQAVRGFSFTTEEYSKGLNRKLSGDDSEYFWNCFCRWREKTPIAEADRSMIMKKLENWIEIRVEGIMQANKRNYYGECAAFVAALGEVKESCGEKSGKQKLMDTYRQKYSRRRAFHQELRSVGLR